MIEDERQMMPRGQWMATEGRELYHDWLRDLIARHAEQSDTYSDSSVRLTRGGGWDDLAENEVVEDNLMHFAHQFVYNLVTKTDPARSTDLSPLMAAVDKIKYYTSADDMLGDTSNWPRAVEEHARDGILFAARVSLGLAYDAYQAAGHAVENTANTYEKLSAIMHDPSFHQVLETFSTTGFAVLGNDSRRVMLHEDMAFRISLMLGLNESPVRHVVTITRGDDDSLSYGLNPLVTEKLIDRLREQNKTRKIKNIGSYVIQRHLAGHSFTTGCPVRKAPVSELEKGNDKSGIALLADYIGDQLDHVVGNRLRTARALASTAAQEY